MVGVFGYKEADRKLASLSLLIDSLFPDARSGWINPSAQFCSTPEKRESKSTSRSRRGLPEANAGRERSPEGL